MSFISGFAFSICDSANRLEPDLSKFPPASCFPKTAALLTGKIPEQILSWSAKNNSSDGQPRPLSRYNDNLVSARLIAGLATELNTSIQETVAETLIRIAAVCLAYNLGIPVEKGRQRLFTDYPEGETAISRSNVSSALPAYLLGPKISENAQKIQSSQSGLTLEACSQVASDSLLADAAFPVLVARAFECTPSPWKPTDSFEEFRTTLTQKGPMIVWGMLGSAWYSTPPGHHPIAILGLETFDWGQSGGPTGVQKMQHAVLIIGAGILDSNPIVYYVDSNHLSPLTVFALPYHQLQNTAIGAPGITVTFESKIDPSLLTYSSKSQTFGYHAADWKIPPTQLS